MVKHHQCCVKVLFSTIDFDVLLCKITRIVQPITKNLCIGQHVFVFVRWSDFSICNEDMLNSLYVHEDCIFKFENVSYNSANVLPMLKLGCIALTVNDLHPKNECIDMYCSYNIYHCLSKFLCDDIARLCWHDIANINWTVVNENKNHKLQLVITTYSWHVLYKKSSVRHVFNEESIIQRFGSATIDKLMDIIQKKRVLNSIYYLEWLDLLDTKDSHSRFFHIITFSAD
jgi:hypothetical protein